MDSDEHTDARVQADCGDGLDRRRLMRLGGMAAAAVATATAATVAASSPASAGVDGDVVLGSSGNTTTAATGIAVSGSSAAYGFGVTDNGRADWVVLRPALYGTSQDSNFNAGVVGEAQGGTGVFGASVSGFGVRAFSASATALYAQSNAGRGIEVIAHSDGVVASSDAIAVKATSGSNLPTVEAVNSGSGSGLLAQSGTGVCVDALNTLSTNTLPVVRAKSIGKGSAVSAQTLAAATAPAVQATSGAAAQAAVRATGVAKAVSASVPVAGNGPALTVQGVASFTRSGVASVLAGTSSIVVNVPGGLTAASHVLATAQTNLGTLSVRAAVPNTTTGKITIYLSGSVPASQSFSVGWFVFG